MKPRTIILLGIAIACGVAAMYMTNRLLADKGAAPPPANTVKVLVSKQKINAWTPIKKPEDVFEVKEVAEGTYSTKCIIDFKDLKDQALKQPLNEQMPVTKDDLVSEATAGLQGLLKEGQRAIAIRVTPESLVGGFVLPGSHVDVMFIKKRGDLDSDSQIILQDMLILAVDMKKTRDEGQDAMLGNTATLAATAEEAEELALAGSLGDLRLLLRTQLDSIHTKYKKVTITDFARQHHQDDDQAKTDGSDTASPTNGSATLPNLPKVTPTTPEPVKVAETPSAPPPPVTFTMKIINADTVSRSVFVWDDKNNCWEGGDSANKADAKKPEGAPKPADAPKPEKTPAAVPDAGPVG